MKKIILILAWFVFLGSSIYAYTPTPEEEQRTQKLVAALDTFIAGDKAQLRHFYSQMLDLQDVFGEDQRLSYLIGTIRDHLHTKLQTMKTPKLLDGKIYKESFVYNYGSGIIQNHSIPQKCRDRRQYMDDISFVHNLPTAITMATRYAESTCGFYLPVHPTYGSNWPFQIITKDYGTGEMTESLFRQTVQDFVWFAWHKINSYEKSNSKEWLKVNLTYDTFDFTGVVRFGALYNGLSWSTIKWDIQPMKRWYVFNNYEPAYSGAVRHGLMPMFIKSLQREMDNIYPKLFGNVAGVY